MRERLLLRPASIASQSALTGDVAYLRLFIVNIVMIGRPEAGDRGWVLIDTGLTGASKFIERAAERRFGAGARPAAIILTHGHFDHIGSVQALAKKWDAPVYAHPLELPYLQGQASYPPADPQVGGGLMAWISKIYPRGPIDLREIVELPPSGAVPFLSDWRWIHTPGHSPGHISLWRVRDRCLISGDAVITTRQESAWAVLVQRGEMKGPPAYFTIDWVAAAASAATLAALHPDILVAGHGRPIQGPEVEEKLGALAERFALLAVPERGRYVFRPATPLNGEAYQRPR